MEKHKRKTTWFSFQRKRYLEPSKIKSCLFFSTVYRTWIVLWTNDNLNLVRVTAIVKVLGNTLFWRQNSETKTDLNLAAMVYFWRHRISSR